MEFIDLVVSGPDMSGTSTQINDLINYFRSNNFKVRDMRGTEFDALFHAERFKEFNSDFISFEEFSKNHITTEVQNKIVELLRELKIASMVKNEITTFVDPDSADVWIFEEPTKRSAGQVNRIIEQNRSKFNSEMDPYSAALTHQTYRVDEFLRFRKVLREKNKIIIRSRSEESACYQIFDSEHLPSGIKQDDYLNLPGHKIAFSNPPTHLFFVCGPINWTKDDYLELKKQRSTSRILDDHELNPTYQIMLNHRYASEWINNLYKKGTQLHNSKMPEIHKFNIYDSKEEIRQKMTDILYKIIEENN
jgi:hypothetical protein